MTVTTDLRFFDKERALKNTFPGTDCGNKKCLMICAETLSAAQTMRLNEKQAVEKAIQQHILPEFHCTPAINRHPCQLRILPKVEDNRPIFVFPQTECLSKGTNNPENL